MRLCLRESFQVLYCVLGVVSKTRADLGLSSVSLEKTTTNARTCSMRFLLSMLPPVALNNVTLRLDHAGNSLRLALARRKNPETSMLGMFRRFR